MALMADLLSPPQVLSALLRTFGGNDNGRALPPPQGSSFQAVASVQVLGHVLVPEVLPNTPRVEGGEERLRIEFTINVKRANGLQDVIVQRSVDDFELLHRALRQQRKAHAGKANLPSLPRLKPPLKGALKPEWAGGKRGELQRWLGVIVREQDEFACDELAAFLGVALVSFLGVTPSGAVTPSDSMSGEKDALALNHVSDAASGAVAAFATAMNATGRAGREGSSPLQLIEASPLSPSLLKARGGEKRDERDAMRTYVAALEQALHDARQEREEEQERRHELEATVRQQGAQLEVVLSQLKTEQSVDAQRATAEQQRALLLSQLLRPVDSWKLIANSPSASTGYSADSPEGSSGDEAAQEWPGRDEATQAHGGKVP